jgi:hypothetical protein
LLAALTSFKALDRLSKAVIAEGEPCIPSDSNSFLKSSKYNNGAELCA